MAEGTCLSDSDSSDESEFAPGPGGKKRKVPLQARADEDRATSATSTSPHNRYPRTAARRLCEFRKALYLRRKAAFIALYIDAQDALGAANVKPTSNSSLPDVKNFEKLLPSLEDMGVKAWTPDKPGWRNGLEQEWRARKRRVARKPVERKGWAPEGSFEFEMECQASITLRARTREQGALLKLAHELRSVVLARKPPPPTTITSQTVSAAPAQRPPAVKGAHGTGEDKSPNKSRRKLVPHFQNQTDTASPTPAGEIAPSDAVDGTAVKGGNKKKKKKRSVLANQSNPHHVDNYRSSRGVSPHGSLDPYPQHLDLLSPPPMQLLAARQGQHAVRPAEDEYLCCFCEYELYYGSEKLRRRAIRARRREMKRKENIATKAKNVAEGRGGLRDHDHSDDEGDEEGCEHGRCTCGRAVGDRNGDPGGHVLDDGG